MEFFHLAGMHRASRWIHRVTLPKEDRNEL